MSTLEQIATKIIQEQALIIGPIAWNQAGKVPGIHIVDQKSGALTIDMGDEKTVLNNLVSVYEHLFGRASREVCKDAAASLIAQLAVGEVPTSLQ